MKELIDVINGFSATLCAKMAALNVIFAQIPGLTFRYDLTPCAPLVGGD